jgi:hypothetical protein
MVDVLKVGSLFWMFWYGVVFVCGMIVVLDDMLFQIKWKFNNQIVWMVMCFMLVWHLIITYSCMFTSTSPGLQLEAAPQARLLRPSGLRLHAGRRQPTVSARDQHQSGPELGWGAVCFYLCNYEIGLDSGAAQLLLVWCSTCCDLLRLY